LVGLGASYKKAKQLKKAASYFEKALVLDHSDVVAARAALLNIYFELGQYDAVANILSRYDEQNAWVAYSRALLSYVRSGDSEASLFLRAQAKSLNHHVPALMSQRKEAPSNPRLDHAVGSLDEAAFYVSDAQNAWRKVIGSIVWLVDG
jgi:tetratricopeptide (TPR) repeat protein